MFHMEGLFRSLDGGEGGGAWTSVASSVVVRKYEGLGGNGDREA